jgi:cell fate (sporulation/competence/biofilm development) regulator YlbF (YheA/YmcA/DUF963 family)
MMTNLTVNDLELASPAVVRQAAHDFAAALAATGQFTALEAASERLRQDQAAQHAVQAYQAKQQSLQAILMLNALSPDEQTELECLREAFLAEASVAAYLRTEADLRALCQTTADLLSEHVGLNFASACSSGCC